MGFSQDLTTKSNSTDISAHICSPRKKHERVSSISEFSNEGYVSTARVQLLAE